MTLNVTNNTQETVMFDPTEMIGILDLRSLGYYKIKQGVLQQNMSKHYHFESVHVVCSQFNRFVNMLKKEEEENKERYPWLDKSDEKKYMTDGETLDKYIDLDKLCLMRGEKEEVRELLYEYKDAFNLRDKIATCPNSEVEIDVIDKALFFIRPYHTKEEDKNTLDMEMKMLCYLGILKEGFSAYSSPVMLISRKVETRQESSDRF